VLTLEELQARRIQLESRLAELVRDDQTLEAESRQYRHLQSLGARPERGRGLPASVGTEVG
jgi:hypothetical protein